MIAGLHLVLSENHALHSISLSISHQLNSRKNHYKKDVVVCKDAQDSPVNFHLSEGQCTCHVLHTGDTP
jgi:hypothetical protein